MAICYHKEAFALGSFSALLIVIIIILFEDVIVKWFRRFKRSVS